MTKGNVSQTAQRMAIIAVCIVIVCAAALYLYTEWPREADTVYKESYETVTLSFSDSRSGEAINPAVTLTGTAFGPLKVTAEGGAAVYTGVPKGTYTVAGELTNFYDLSTSDEIKSETDTYSASFKMDNIGTFSWGETESTITLAGNENNIIVFRAHLTNSTADTVLKNVTHKLVITMTDTQALYTEITDVSCDSHTLSDDDETAEKWIISGTGTDSIGSIV